MINIDCQHTSVQTDSTLNIDIDILSCNSYKEQSAKELTTKIANRFKEFLPKLNIKFRQFLSNCLLEYGYDTEQFQFQQILTVNRLELFRNDLQATRDALDAYRAAWDGNQQLVEIFLEQYPIFKDKPGPWGTTLLFSAARNGRLDMVKYLLGICHCSIDAPNRQHIQRALQMDSITATDYNADPSAGSTALHGACYGGHLDTVRYLTENGANCFSRNQAEETPIMNATKWPDLVEYFQDFLNLGYVEQRQDLPEYPIREMDQNRKQDCVWEFLPFCYPETWLPFDKPEMEQLNELMVVKDNKHFQVEYQWNISQTISMIRFLQYGKHLTWVRCRGSSILNFNCFSLWQVFYLEHPNGKYDQQNPMSMKILNLSLLDEGQLDIQLNTWYNCDANSNDRLDDAMNNRRKYIEFSLVDQSVRFDLMGFTFKNEDDTISGFIRWIPKLVSNNEHRIVPIDNFQTPSNINPMLLTIEHQKKALNSVFALEDDDETPIEHDIVQDDQQPEKPTSLVEDGGDDALEEPNSCDGEVEMNVDQYIDDNQANEKASMQLAGAKTSTSEEEIEKLHAKISEFETLRTVESLNLQTRCHALEQEHALKLEEKEEVVRAALAKIDSLTKELEPLKEQHDCLQKMKQQIKSIEYNQIPREAMHDFLLPTFEYFLGQLRAATPGIKEDDHHGIVTVKFRETDNGYQLTIQGLPEHHVAFQGMLKRVLTLFNCQTSSIEYYERHSNRILRSISQTLRDVNVQTKSWRQYTAILKRLMNTKMMDYRAKFNHYIRAKATSLTERAISNQFLSPSVELRQFTNGFIDEHSFLNEIQEFKYEAMEEFIQQNVTLQFTHLNKRPRPSSIQTLNIFLDRIKNQLKTKPNFIGYEVKHWKLIPDLLKQILIYHSCFLLQLPLFDESIKLLNMIETHTVTAIATPTGSGKSTLLPALLVAEGYDRILVTQPRRYPCTAVSNRVNETIRTDIDGTSEQLAGWAISGDGDRPDAPIVYVTDGLLRESLLNNPNFIPLYTEMKKAMVFFIDEVHERSINIDLCLALLARLLTVRPELKTTIKLIISSATLNSSVPRLFQQFGLREFRLPQIGLLHDVKRISRPRENILDIVQELFKKRRRHDQILCFVNSTTEVHQCCRLLEQLTQGTIKGYPLIQSQSAAEQQAYIEHGSVFFSTTVAETSLTFPSLKYVVDTGMINIPIYDPKTKRTVLKQVQAAESTIKQRLGRLGRTQNGEYYALYDFQVEDQPFPIPQICQLDLTNIDFILRRSTIGHGLHYMQQFLPDKPDTNALGTIVEELVRLNVLERTSTGERFTPHGRALAQLPDFNSIAMSKSVLAALTQYDCGRDLICLSSILGCLNTASILKDIPPAMKSSDGDFMTLLNVMNEILLVKQSSTGQKIDLDLICQQKQLDKIRHILKQALRRYESLEKLFNKSQQFRQQSQIRSENWRSIAKALLEGYGDNVFVSMKEIQERTHQFGRYRDTNDIAILDLQSTLTRPISHAPVRLVLSRDVLYTSAARSTSIISFVGELKPSWIEHQLERHFLLTTDEKNHLENGNALAKIRSVVATLVNWIQNKSAYVLKNRAGIVFNDEVQLRSELITTRTFQLENRCRQGTTEYENLARNLQSVTKIIYIFQPIQWRWEAEKQMKITVDNNPAAKTCDITVEGRLSEQENVKKEFDRFGDWLKRCVVIRHPNSGVLPRLLQPKVRSKYPHIEKNIACIADPNRTLVELYKAVKGKKATRESRMEVVAWIAVCQFHCKLEGGFVRDWIVGNEAFVPINLQNDPKAWIEYRPGEEGQDIPGIRKEIVPSDLDCHLPLNKYFDMEKFQDRLHKFDIICKVFRQKWRYIVLIDEDVPTGPFTMDLIEPHVALTQDRIDLDVSNLSVERNYPRELGMRINVTQSPYSIDLESIVENVMERRFRVLRPIDRIVKDRIEKMVQRGWKQYGDPINVNPSPPPHCYSVLIPLPGTSPLYQSLENEMKKISLLVRIISIEEVKNPLLEDTYEAIKKMIAKECQGANPNEQKLFHGTKVNGMRGILENGFDDRFFSSAGAWGAGAYFADDPRKSHNYTKPEGSDQTRVMFYNKVALGKESIEAKTKNDLAAAPKGCHSVRGTEFKYTEYIVYRFGQALPYLRIIYKA
ncbi:unnamed protein product [Adineta ricciae]|uniref:Poly [ADP-ribose] polymerase n=1 Tax=Adineta ricciae TaxID=249248 RepID=A0A813XVS6_ADIRI|nr:unnamed protein product [Adineta ricciae]CAF1454489.1 unnamed protein product [Adineta ricciae]